MIVLRAIGAFFARIWRWIKETAWVQPLLIVGIIFGVIFSIPAIVNGIKSVNEQMASTETYYRQFQYSLEGGKDSKADKITSGILDKANGANTSVLSELGLGDKFFLLFVSDDCSGCKDAKGGFTVFQEEFNGKFSPNDGTKFQMVTIFTDQITTETTTKESAFVQYMDRNQDFFEYAAGVGYNTDYFLNGFITKSDLEKVEQVDANEFLTPTIMLIDFTDTTPEYGVSEIMFGVTGDTDYKRAETLLDCWTHDGDFSKDPTK